MSWIKSHTKKIEAAARRWLQPDNYGLKEAIDKTINEGLFSFEDVKHQILVLKKNVEVGQISEWVKRSGLDIHHQSKGKKALCLHAGNLPLVGFQTALGIILSGDDYYGKLSRKDPYLLAAFLDELQKSELNNVMYYSKELYEFENLQAHKVIFAGSSESVPKVKKEIQRLNAAKADAQYLTRTAKFSIAYIDHQEPQTMKDLTESIFRYGGQGCRSVAMVVAKYPLDSVKCGFTDYIESFWLKNPQHQKAKPNLKYQFAYNKAIGRSQAWLDDFLIQESEAMPDIDFTVNWVQGGKEKVIELKEKFGEVVQSVYTTGLRIEGVETELLSQAQAPPLWWKPDGISIL